MRRHVALPDTDEVVGELEAGQVAQAISMVRNPVQKLLQTDPSEYSYEEMLFVTITLPESFRMFTDHERRGHKVAAEFATEYVAMTAAVNLDARLFVPLCDSMDMFKVDVNIFEVMELSDPETKEILQFRSDSKLLRNGHPESDPFHAKLLLSCFKSGLWTKVLNMLSCGDMQPDQFALVLRMFRSMEAFLSKSVVSALLPILIDEDLNMLAARKSDFGGGCNFLSLFVKMATGRVENIVDRLCALMAEGPVQARFAATSNLISVEKAVNIGRCADRLKVSFMAAAGSFSNVDHLAQVVGFLPRLAKKTSFNEADLCAILNMTHLQVDKRCDVIVEIVQTMEDEKLDGLGEILLESNISSPGIYCVAVGKTSPALSESLFKKMLHGPRELLMTIPATMVKNTKVAKLIHQELEDVEDPEILESLSFFVMAANRVTEMNEFVEKTIVLAEEKPSLIRILNNFSTSIKNGVQSDELVGQLFEATYNHLTRGDCPEFISGAVDVLIQWIESAKGVPEKIVYNKLKRISITNAPAAFLKLISAIVGNTRDKRKKSELLTKIVHDTVLPKFSHWAVHLVFSNFHDNKTKVKSICETLVSHLGDSDKRRNALFMIQRCVQYEADFFRIGEEFGSVFSILIHGARQCDLKISLHPYHSCRRIYAEVQKALNLPVQKFHLNYVTNRCVEKCILASTPLSMVVDDFESVSLKILLEDTTVEGFDVPTYFIDALFQNGVVELYKLLNSNDDADVSNIMIEIIQLCPDLGELEEPTSARQWLLSRYPNPLEFSENKQLFPIALSVLSEMEMANGEFEHVLMAVTSGGYDRLSMIMMSKTISQIKVPDFVFSEDLTRRCFIENPHECSRIAILTHYTNKNNMDDLLHLMSLVLTCEYRSRSEQFLKCFEVFEDVPREIFLPFFRDMDQFEDLNEVDQTFISLLRLIPKNEETVKLVYQRISVAPTVKCLNNPFVHSERGRLAAFEFLKTECVFPELLLHFHQLPSVPSALQKFSDDFTPKGRNGISNLGSTCYVNALLQSINTLNPMVHAILSLPTEGTSQFMLQLRDFIANLRFSRGASVSIQTLVDQIPNFDGRIQEDAEEFLNHLINRVLEEMDDPSAIKAEVQGSHVSCLCSGSEILSSHTEDIYVTSLPTKDMSNLLESFVKYFEDERIDGGYRVENSPDPVEAHRRVRIKHWPRTLIFQLQRWDFRLATSERIKLVHEFAFPTTLRASDLSIAADDGLCESDYALSAVVVHKGDPERGHYYAIVDGDNGEWYLCDDVHIVPFDIANLSDFFGVQGATAADRDSVATGYLLFYRRVGQPAVEQVLPIDLETRINRANEMNWPATFFYSHEFVNFAADLVRRYVCQASDVAFTVFFKVVVLDEKLHRAWESFLCDEILHTRELCEAMFSFIERVLGTNLGPIVALSDLALGVIQRVVCHALTLVPESAKPLRIVLRAIAFHDHRRSMSLAFDAIWTVCQDMKIAWSEEDETLMLMTEYGVRDMTKELLRTLRKQHSDAVESVLNVTYNVVLLKGMVEAATLWFNTSVIIRLKQVLQRSDSFRGLVLSANSSRPSLLTDLHDAPTQVQQLIGAAAAAAPSENSALVNVDVSYLDAILPEIAFCRDSRVRAHVAKVLLRVMPKPDPVVEKYIVRSAFEGGRTEQKQPLSEENAFADLFLGLVPAGLTDLGTFVEYADVLSELCTVSPFGAGTLLPEIVEAAGHASSPAIISKFMIIITRIVSYEPDLMSAIPEPVIASFLSSDEASDTSVAFICLVGDMANESALSGACVTRALSSRYSKYTEKLVALIEGGLKPGPFTIPERAKDPMNIRLVLALLRVYHDARDALIQHALTIVRAVRLRTVFDKSVVFRAAETVLGNLCRTQFEEVIAELI